MTFTKRHTERDYEAVKQAYLAGGKSYAEIGKGFGVSRCAIASMIARLRQWGELPHPDKTLPAGKVTARAKSVGRTFKVRGKSKTAAVVSIADLPDTHQVPFPAPLGRCAAFAGASGWQGMCCGLPVARGSYCESHAARYYEKPKAKLEGLATL